MPLFRRKEPLPVELPIVSAKGRNGELELYEHKIRVKRHGVTDIMLSNITSVAFRPAGRLSHGAIEIYYPGHSDLNRPDRTSFKRKQQKDFERFREELDRRISAI